MLKTRISCASDFGLLDDDSFRTWLVGADWYYAFSDDHSVWSSWHSAFNELERYLDLLRPGHPRRKMFADIHRANFDNENFIGPYESPMKEFNDGGDDE